MHGDTAGEEEKDRRHKPLGERWREYKYFWINVNIIGLKPWSSRHRAEQVRKWRHQFTRQAQLVSFYMSEIMIIIVIKDLFDNYARNILLLISSMHPQKYLNCPALCGKMFPFFTIKEIQFVKVFNCSREMIKKSFISISPSLRHYIRPL